MENLFLDSTVKTPQVVFDANSNELVLSGRSLPENANDFYEPIKSWLIEYFSKTNTKSTFVFDLKYYNTSSSKLILELLNIFKNAIQNGQDLSIIWKYEKNDEDTKEDVNDFSDIVGVPIELKVLP